MQEHKYTADDTPPVEKLVINTICNAAMMGRQWPDDVAFGPHAWGQVCRAAARLATAEQKEGFSWELQHMDYESSCALIAKALSLGARVDSAVDDTLRGPVEPGKEPKDRPLTIEVRGTGGTVH